MKSSIPTFSEIQELKQRLIAYWRPNNERCGIVQASGEIMEAPNLADHPGDQFVFPEGVLDGAFASWHTHPMTSANLSIADFHFFKSWSNQVHFIISKSDVRCYIDLNNNLIAVDEADDLSPWASESPPPGTH